jgi:hypothetical protein
MYSVHLTVYNFSLWNSTEAISSFPDGSFLNRPSSSLFHLSLCLFILQPKMRINSFPPSREMVINLYCAKLGKGIKNTFQSDSTALRYFIL